MTNTLKILTNNHWHQFLYRTEVPLAVLNNELDWCDDEDNFFKYKDWYYSLSEFLTIDKKFSIFSSWHGYKGDSYFSGTLIRLSDDGEEYQIATYLSCDL